jgi:Zn-dependent protease with chaperone function
VTTASSPRSGRPNRRGGSGVRRRDGAVRTTCWSRRSRAARRAPASAALVAHELGHAGAGDPGRSWFIGSSTGSLRRWVDLLRPSAFQPRRTLRPGTGGTGAGIALLAELVVPLILLPLTAVVSALLAATTHIINRRSRRCELLADRCAVHVAGADATDGLLQGLLLEDVVRIAISSARAGGDATDARLPAARAVARVPLDERARRLRREELLGDTGDSTHPPVFRRIRLVRSLAPAAPQSQVDPQRMTQIDQELDDVWYGRR